MSVPKIVEIMHTIYQGLFKTRLCEECVGRKVNNTLGLNCAELLPFHELSPSLQSNNLAWAHHPMENPVPGQQSTLKKCDLNELLIWACNMVTWYYSADILFWQSSLIEL